MEQYLIILLTVLIVMIAILIVAVIFFIFIFLKKEPHAALQESQSINFKSREKQLEPLYGRCITHTDERAAGICNICEQSFCASCLHGHEALNFCSEHYSIFLSTEWVELDSVETTPSHPEKGTRIYKFKQKIWETDQLPTYLQTHYKIDHTTDEIGSVVSLYAPLDKISEIKIKLNSF